MKRITKTSEEFDVVSRWRHIYRWRPGEVAAIKRRMQRRERYVAKREIERGRATGDWE